MMRDRSWPIRTFKNSLAWVLSKCFPVAKTPREDARDRMKKVNERWPARVPDVQRPSKWLH